MNQNLMLFLTKEVIVGRKHISFFLNNSNETIFRNSLSVDEKVVRKAFLFNNSPR